MSHVPPWSALRSTGPKEDAFAAHGVWDGRLQVGVGGGGGAYTEGREEREDTITSSQSQCPVQFTHSTAIVTNERIHFVHVMRLSLLEGTLFPEQGKNPVRPIAARCKIDGLFGW
jgi:hypothetical protein